MHAADGLDEISLDGDTYVAELKDGQVTEYTLNPAQFGINSSASSRLAVHNIDEAKAKLHSVFDQQPGPARDIVALNAGAAIYVAGLAASLNEGVEKAQDAIASGAAKAKLAQLIRFTQQFAAS